MSDSVARPHILPLLPAVPPQRPCCHTRGEISPLGGWTEHLLKLSLCLSHLLSGCSATRSRSNLKSCTEPAWAGPIEGENAAQLVTRGLRLPTPLTEHVHTRAGKLRQTKGTPPCTQFLELLTQEEDLWPWGPDSKLTHYAKSHRNSAPVTVLPASPEPTRETIRPGLWSDQWGGQAEKSESEANLGLMERSYPKTATTRKSCRERQQEQARLR